jgi:hypothetical protein
MLFKNQIANLNYKLEIIDKENKKYLNLLGDENRDTNKNNTENNSIEFNVKLDILQKDNISLMSEKNELREMLEKLNEELALTNKKLEKYLKKEDKYKRTKEIKSNLILKNTELTEENLILKEKNKKILLEENEKFKLKENLLNVKIIIFNYFI